VSRDNPRSDKWAEWYTLRPNTVSNWGEVNGYDPKHESFCPNDADQHPDVDPDTVCWCTAFCGFCDHHEKHHTYGLPRGEPVPCAQCPDEVCPRQPAPL
jgi:hypothetical protein